MSFYGLSFIYDSTPSELYNLYLGSLNDGGESTTSGSANVNLLTEKLFRRPSLLFFGAEVSPVLQFTLPVYSPDEITAEDYSLIGKWLFATQNYKKLRICQADMSEIYFNCFLTNPQPVRAGNIIRAFTATAICDSPWGWRQPITLLYDYSTPEKYLISDTIDIVNRSANNFYTYPTSLVITANGFDGFVTITNSVEPTRVFTLGLVAGETITINCDTQTIVSDTQTYPLSSFNLNWLRFLPGLNTLSILGTITTLSISYPLAVKVA
jgi:phage-related protein